MATTRRVLWLAAAGLAACGRLADQAGAGGGVGVPGAGGDAITDPGMPNEPACSPAASLAPARIMLLTDAQYVNAVRDVFGVQLQGDITLQANDSRSDYPTNEEAVVTSNRVEAYHSASKQVASKLKPCGANPPDAPCVEAFLRSKVPLAWRRPVTDDEVASIMSLFTAGLAIGPDRAVEVVTGAILESGSFLYRTEIGKSATGGASTALTPHELASAVSFAFFDSVPDASLWAKAEDGSLLQPSVLSAEADRLLEMQAVRDNLRKKVSFFLDLEKIPMTNNDPFSSKGGFPEYAFGVRADLYRGAELFLDDVVWRGHFQDLFTSHRVYVNKDLGLMYDIPGVSTAELAGVDVATDVRGAGILTQPAFLAATNQHDGSDDIVHRGQFLYNTLVCGPVIAGPPPEEHDVFSSLPGTTQEKWRQVEMDCGSCHTLFNPLGRASQAYDPIGRYRMTDPENGQPIDTAGVIQGLGPDLDGPVSGINDLAKRFAAGRRASDCAAGHLSRMTLERALPGGVDSCQLKTIKDELAQNGSFPAFFKAIVTSPAFLTRDLEAQ